MVLANPIHNLTDLQQQSPLRKASSTTGIATRMLPLVLPLACYHSHATTRMLPLACYHSHATTGIATRMQSLYPIQNR